MKNSSIYEVVVYEVKEGNESKDYIQKEVNNAVSKYKGFISRQVFQSTENPDIFMDYCEWDSLENATDAAESSQKDPELAPFMALISEVKSFYHLEKVRHETAESI